MNNLTTTLNYEKEYFRLQESYNNEMCKITEKYESKIKNLTDKNKILSKQVNILIETIGTMAGVFKKEG